MKHEELPKRFFFETCALGEYEPYIFERIITKETEKSYQFSDCKGWIRKPSGFDTWDEAYKAMVSRLGLDLAHIENDKSRILRKIQQAFILHLHQVLQE